MTMKSKEAQLQSECVKWFRLQYRDKVIFAIPNGGSRNPIEGANLKRQGVLAGVCDLFIPEPITKHSPKDTRFGSVTKPQSYHGMFIEMKFGKGKSTEAQKQFQSAMSARGYRIEIVNSFDDFKKIVDEYFCNSGISNGNGARVENHGKSWKTISNEVSV